MSGLHLTLLSVHGLVRGDRLELGRDADTGGQVLYVVELAKALGRRDDVSQVDLVTRRLVSPRVDADYAEIEHWIAPKVRIVRVDGGEPGYLPKERLWNHLDSMADHLAARYAEEGRRPDVLHSHYADAGYMGVRLAHRFGVPLIHTGHSLGRVKRRRLLAFGLDGQAIERRYNMARRVEAEEQTLAAASLVIASTHQEIEEQYELYNFYRPDAMRVLPPGVDLSRFHPPTGDETGAPIHAELKRFLRDPERPMILALSRADVRKNVDALVHAYGRSERLREQANLVVVMGTRDDIADLEEGARGVLTDLLQMVDRYDLYGQVAYPKRHGHDDVPTLYRLAARTCGVFVNPALTEPFGLTLIEAAASGLPIIATADGGPRDIVANCRNGLLIDPLDIAGIGKAVEEVLGDPAGWRARSTAGIAGVREHYTWNAHVADYLDMVRPLLAEAPALGERGPRLPRQRRLALYADRALFTDLNRILIGDDASLRELLDLVRENRGKLLFGIVTGLRLDAALRVLRRHRIPEPDVLVTSTGTAITYAPKLTEDIAWTRHIEKQWTPRVVRRVLRDVPGVTMRERAEQSSFKVSLLYDRDYAPPISEIKSLLRREEQAVNVRFSHDRYLNVLPVRASKGLALRYLADRFEIPLERVLAIGGSGADADMLRGNTLAAIVGPDSHRELAELESDATVFVAPRDHAAGVLDAVRHFDLLGECRVPVVEETVTAIAVPTETESS